MGLRQVLPEHLRFRSCNLSDPVCLIVLLRFSSLCGVSLLLNPVELQRSFSNGLVLGSALFYQWSHERSSHRPSPPARQSVSLWTISCATFGQEIAGVLDCAKCTRSPPKVSWWDMATSAFSVREIRLSHAVTGMVDKGVCLTFAWSLCVLRTDSLKGKPGYILRKHCHYIEFIDDTRLATTPALRQKAELAK